MFVHETLPPLQRQLHSQIVAESSAIVREAHATVVNLTPQLGLKYQFWQKDGRTRFCDSRISSCDDRSLKLNKLIFLLTCQSTLQI
ncbi:hypothetical protein V9T40_003401 [Parthenolecanium corni]|uniref:Uncharacterized protein n=1 Tax=Parthenolecanium corni TaxID=536013 RepID=A0AAN9TT34_9HEMI